jgi:hypothetical protein
LRATAGRLLAVCLLAVGSTGCGLLVDDGESPAERAAGIAGLVNYRESDPDMLTREHVRVAVDYPVRPPVGGDHSDHWQNCQGDVYDAPIANEHAVHSLEHGAVWITYHPGLPSDHLAALVERVQGTDKLFMSPYPGLDVPISLQAWGFQLKVDSAGDERIDQFIRALRITASLEGPSAPCGVGVTTTGPVGVSTS